MKDNKNVVILSILAVLLLIAVAMGISYSYFAFKVENNSDVLVETTTSKGSVVEYTKGESVELVLAEPGTKKSSTFIISLEAPADSSDTIKYGFLWDISENEFIYESEHPTDPQLIYSIYNSTDNTNWTSYKENIDCTTLSGENIIVDNMTLTANAGTTNTIYWKFVLEYKAYDYNQATNMSKYFTGKLSINGIE